MLIKNKKWKNIIFLSIACVSIIFLFEIAPRIYNVAGLTIDLIVQKYKIDSNKENDELISEYGVRNKALKRKIGRVVSDYERSRNISDILSFVDSAAQRTKVNIREIKPGKIIRNNNLWLQPVDINISARYENFYNYVRSLENSSKVMLIKKLTMISGESLGGSLDIKLHLEIYLNI
ncbi:MAG: type 4a pilus biogenesis protein PilO [Ignavibacteriales bacterium]|nr:type 4a pilus biogenesis protein PilO [Ignavibacteriales bacterium]